MLHVKIDTTRQKRTACEDYQNAEFAQEYVIKTHAELVRRIAWQVFSRMSKTVELEDLIQIGLMALIDAAKGYEDRGFAFATYASTRVRGAMIDQLRREAHMSRSAITNRRKIADTKARLERELMRQPDSGEMADGMKLTPAAYHDLVSNSASTDGGSIDELYSDHDMWFADTTAAADTVLEQEQLQEQLKVGLACLPQREAMILQLFFVEELNLDEIGKTLGVGAARVCQIKKAALQKLRAQMEQAG
jgi:RNA polymerase sigma factor FliA